MYKNIMENMVEMKIDEYFNRYDGCKCQTCRENIISIALNNLPTRYVTTPTGELYSKVNDAIERYETEVLTQIALASMKVKDKPRH